MKKLDELAVKLQILPRLKLGMKLQGGGVKSRGPVHVKFLEEPTIVQGRSFEGKPQEEVRFILEVDGIKCKWNVPVLNRSGEANYLIERLLGVEVGDERILEMVKKGIKNYIDVREVDEMQNEPSIEDHEE